MKPAIQLLFLQLIIFQTNLVKSDLSTNIENGINEYIKNGTEPNDLRSTIKEFFNTNNKSNQNEAHCTSCKIKYKIVLQYYKNGASITQMYNLLQKLCVWFNSFDETVCSGFITVKIDTIMYVIENTPNLSADRICGIMNQDKNCVDPNLKPWSINISNESPLPVKKNEAVDSKPIKILHLSDIHYDPWYRPGSDAHCNKPLCCQEIDDNITTPINAAGYWGDYAVCDIPWHTVLDSLEQSKTHQPFDFVYYTGDTIHHKGWATTKNGNSLLIKKVHQQLEDTYRSIPVYPVLGNHEFHPSDYLSFDNVTNPLVSTQWMFDLVASDWMRWLPKESQETILKGGFYTVLVRPGFRIIALNSNVCYISNIWLIYNDKDPYGQLQWLADVLLKAEKDGELVHILSHVPPGDKMCLKQWNHEFYRIVNRFANIIKGQFNGHTHSDEIRIFYNPSNSQVSNIAYNGGSLTTFVGNNPNYKIYEISPENYSVTNYETWSYNLTLANLNPLQLPKWFKLYSFKEAYGLKTLEPSDFDQLLNKMASNSTLIEQYYRYLSREGKPFLEKGCDPECLVELLCAIVDVDFEESIQCRSLKKQFYENYKKQIH